MCCFMSCNSNGKGKVQFFKVEDIAKIMAKGNPKNYDWNSHTSIAHYNGILGADEDKWNKWEYNPEKKTLTAGTLNTADDGKIVKKKIEQYLKGKNIGYLRNLYNLNSGNRNSDYYNSGYYNSGYQNSGNYNSGYYNSGDRNSGNYNSGNYNSGDYNSGNYNSGNYNSGNNNSGCIVGHFTTQKLYFLFNKPCTKEEADKVYEIELWKYFKLTEWIGKAKMTQEEKEQHPTYKTTGGYLKTRTYKEAWALIPKEQIEQIKKLKNYDPKIFEEITGITQERI